MRKFLYQLSTRSNFLNKLIWGLYRTQNSMIPLELRLKHRFKRTLGYKLDLKSPKTFNEKIQWLKIHDRTPSHVICSDKYAVRDYIKTKIGENHLVPLILHTKSVEDLVPKNFPDFPVIIKTNHDSGGGTIIRDKHAADWNLIQKSFKRRLSFNYDYGKGEWQYGSIEPCIIVEKLLLDKDGNVPSDYKMHFFNGQLIFTHVDTDRFTEHRRNLYDSEWNYIPCSLLYPNGRLVDKPGVYDQMIEIGHILSRDFIYVRVDLYVIGDQIFFGELTFHHGSGNEPFTPPEYDLLFGEKLVLPIEINQ